MRESSDLVQRHSHLRISEPTGGWGTEGHGEKGDSDGDERGDNDGDEREKRANDGCICDNKIKCPSANSRSMDLYSVEHHIKSYIIQGCVINSFI